MWVTQHFDPVRPATSLRSEELGQELSDYPNTWFCSKTNIYDIQALLARRQEILNTREGSEKSKAGRILCAFYGWDTAMGEGTPASKAVIDDAYLPPWDTWFAVLPLVREGSDAEYVLLAWIPSELETLVQDAINVGATEPIEWLDIKSSGAWHQFSARRLTLDDWHLLQVAHEELSSSPA